MIDITPELLKSIQDDFYKQLNSNANIKRLKQLIDTGKATYIEANDFSIEVGSILSKALRNNISGAALPDGRLYFNIADRILKTTLGTNHELISEVASKVQTDLNKEAGIGVQALKAPLNQSRVDGLISRVSSELEFDKVSWILDEPIVNFSQSIIDDTIKTNAEFHNRLGLKPKIYRRVSPGCCEWCEAVAGTYNYPDVPQDIYRRHERCRCTVEYTPGDGKFQNVHTKRWV